MQTTTKLLGVALVALVAFTGFAAAGGAGTMASTADQTYGAADGAPYGNVTAAERALDGSNSPWVTGDERLDRFQDRFDLTDEQVQAIQEEVQTLSESDADPTEIRETVQSMLTEFGVEAPALGPPADGQLGGGSGHAHGHGQGGFGGTGGQSGPHGPADGSCLA